MSSEEPASFSVGQVVYYGEFRQPARVIKVHEEESGYFYIVQRDRDGEQMRCSPHLLAAVSNKKWYFFERKKILESHCKKPDFYRPMKPATKIPSPKKTQKTMKSRQE